VESRTPKIKDDHKREVPWEWDGVGEENTPTTANGERRNEDTKE